MNSLSYLSRQFDVIASTSAPNTLPSTPTGEDGPEVDSEYQRPSLKRIRTWASARSFFLPQEFTRRRHTQPPVRSRKRSGSSPNRSHFTLTSSVPTSEPLPDVTFGHESGELLAATTQLPIPPLHIPQPKTISSRGPTWLSKLYFLRVIFLFASWLCAVWLGLTRPLRGESETTKGKGADRTFMEESSNVKDEDVDGVRARQTRLKDAGKSSFVRARASSIIKIVLQPKPPTPSPLSRSTLTPPPVLNLIPPDSSDDDETCDRSIDSPYAVASPSTSSLSPRPRTPPSKQASLAGTAASSTPTKSTPLHTRKTLVLDLDETLIHSTTRPLPGLNSGMFNLGSLVGFGRNRKAGHIVEVVMGGRSTLYHVYKRPFVDYFLRKVSAWYTLVIFTASMKEYADPVIDWLDAGRGILTLRFFREHCTQLPNGSYSKDLSILDEDLARVCLIDNSPASYSINKANGIPIEGWTHDPNDEALLDLLPVLDSLRFTGDVRHVLGLRGF